VKIFLSQNVFDAALERIRYLFDEFPNIIVNVSGGKDSTVVLNLALRVAEEKGRLPLKVMFIDQEAEWEAVIDTIRSIMSDPRVDPIWLQVPCKLFNATSSTEPWLHCWEEGKNWVRPKDPISLKVNKYGADRDHLLFEAYNRTEFPRQPVAHLAGVRCEESPGRMMGLTAQATYKHVTWGAKEDETRGHYTFYPIYDWNLSDVWKAIHDNDWPYCRIYDAMYQKGVPLYHMRVSSFHHETSIKSLFILQELEPDTWNRITARISGVNSAAKLQWDFYAPEKLPFMFDSWREYRDHLLENLVAPGKPLETMRRTFAAEERNYDPCIHDELIKMHIKTILTNDYEGWGQSTFRASRGRWLVKGRYGDGEKGDAGDKRLAAEAV
jgi:predicted phosphoadenosine phosphosulfate sulfurtransferase